MSKVTTMCVTLLSAVVMQVGCGGGASSRGGTPPASNVTVPAASTAAQIQALLDSNPKGTVFNFPPGTYRVTVPVSPQSSQKLISQQQHGAIVSGAQVVSGFQPSGSNWVAAGFLPPTPPDPAHAVRPVPCRVAGVTSCGYNEDVYVDDKLLTRVLPDQSGNCQSSPLATGTYCEDYPNNKIYLADDPTGHTVEQAVASNIIQFCQAGNAHCSDNVTVQDFIIEKSAVPAEFGAIDAE